MSNSSSSSSGIGVLGLLGVAFVVLKLLKIIDWSWWYVTMPFWGGIALALFILAIYGVFLLYDERQHKIRRRKIAGSPSKKPVSRFQKKLEEAMAESKKQ